VPPKPQTWSFNYEDLSSVTGMSKNALQTHRMRGHFDPSSLESVVTFILNHNLVTMLRVNACDKRGRGFDSKHKKKVQCSRGTR
jgi:hypothetical protein